MIDLRTHKYWKLPAFGAQKAENTWYQKNPNFFIV
jgi:hypothetical protein